MLEAGRYFMEAYSFIADRARSEKSPRPVLQFESANRVRWPRRG